MNDKGANRYGKTVLIIAAAVFLIGLFMFVYNVSQANRIKEYNGA